MATLATTPLAIVFVFAPTARHLYAAGAEVQIEVFPAADSAEPSSTVRLVIEEV